MKQTKQKEFGTVRPRVFAWALTLCLLLTLTPVQTVYADGLSEDQEAVDAAYIALTWDKIRGDNTSQMSVLGDLNLLTELDGFDGVKINWIKGGSIIEDKAIELPDGKVIRQVDDTYVTLNATIKQNSATRDKTFYVCVPGTAPWTVKPGEIIDDGVAVEKMTSKLWDTIKNGNLGQVNPGPKTAAANLILLTRGEDWTDISWKSSPTSAIGMDGVVRFGDSKQTVTLTATVSRGNVEETVEFDLTVPARYDFGDHNRPSPHIRTSLGAENLYPTKDYTVSDFNVLAYGAMAAPGFCNREAFQAAIDAAHEAGGGVVYAPAGNYDFHNEAVGGEPGNLYNYVLDLKAGVQLRGDWVDPDKNGGAVVGTVLKVEAGHKSTNESDRFIQMGHDAGVTNLSVWYSNQRVNEVIPHPWTLFQTGGGAALENVTLVNSYNGFYSASGRYDLLNCRITALNTGIKISEGSAGRIENVEIGNYWSGSQLANAPVALDVAGGIEPEDVEVITTDIKDHPKVGINHVFKADLPRATGTSVTVPTVDVSEQLQAALKAVKDVGGGIVYLPAGRYLVKEPIIVPSGVELRGTWDVPHGAESGTVIYTDSQFLLEKNAGVRGLSVVQNNKNDNAPFLINGQGENVYVVNVTVNGVRGVNFADCDDYYVDGFIGELSEQGVWVDEREGFIRNTQINGAEYGAKPVELQYTVEYYADNFSGDPVITVTVPTTRAPKHRLAPAEVKADMEGMGIPNWLNHGKQYLDSTNYGVALISYPTLKNGENVVKVLYMQITTNR